MKQKILYILDTLQTGGAEKSTLDIASRLQEFEPVVCHIYRNDFLKSEFEKNGIRVISLNVAGTYNFIAAYNALKALLRKEKPDLVVATLLRSELISRLACRATGIPNVGTFVNDTYSKFEWQSLSVMMKIKIGLFWLLNMITARLCVSFLSNSISIKQSNCKALFVDPGKVHVIYRGRRTDKFVYVERNFPSKHLKFLAVGRLLYRKGFEELIEAFNIYLKQHKNATLTIAGDGPLRPQLTKIIESYSLEKVVQLPGTLSDIPATMAKHDVFVFPSHYEGFSGTLVEAMLSGIPILASRIPMNEEAVENGKTAYLFEVQNAQAIAEALSWITLHQNEAVKMAEKARRVAETTFDIDTIAHQHEEYYRSVLNTLKT